MTDTPILSVRGLSRRFVQPVAAADQLRSLATHGRLATPKAVRAVQDVSFEIREAEALGLVGESGCGKSTVARLVSRLIPASEGEVLWRGVPLHKCRPRDLLGIQMVFQDPLSSLNPRIRLGDQIAEAVRVHGLASRSELGGYLRRIFEDCGIDPFLAERFPHQVSGGQRQRFGIARALAMKPALILCDEPVAALDVSIQAQIVNLFARLRRERRLAYLFISHDLGVVRHLCDRVAVMYLGRIVEDGPSESVMGCPHHPYTHDLHAAAPRLATGRGAFAPVRGEIPSPLSPPTGCAYHTRCSRAVDQCSETTPTLETVNGRRFACLRPLSADDRRDERFRQPPHPEDEALRHYP